MSDQYPSEHQVLEVIVRSPGTALDDIVLECPNLTWNQVFVTIDKLSREGMIKISPKRLGQYAMHIRTAPPGKYSNTPRCEASWLNACR